MSFAQGGAGAPASPAGPRGVLRNAGFLLLAYLFPRILTFAATVLAARVLGTARFGDYATAAALAVVLSVIATLGMMPLLIREIARDPVRAPALLGTAHRVKTLANAGMLVALFLATRLLGYSPAVTTAALLLGLGYAIGAYGENLAAYFQGIERMEV